MKILACRRKPAALRPGCAWSAASHPAYVSARLLVRDANNLYFLGVTLTNNPLRLPRGPHTRGASAAAPAQVARTCANYNGIKGKPCPLQGHTALGTQARQQPPSEQTQTVHSCRSPAWGQPTPQGFPGPRMAAQLCTNRNLTSFPPQTALGSWSLEEKHCRLGPDAVSLPPERVQRLSDECVHSAATRPPPRPSPPSPLLSRQTHPLRGFWRPELLRVGTPVRLHVLLQNDRRQLGREQAVSAARKGSFHSETHRAPGRAHSPGCPFIRVSTKPQVTYKLALLFLFPTTKSLPSTERPSGMGPSGWTYLTNGQGSLRVHGQLRQVNTKFWKRKRLCVREKQESPSDA